MPAFPLSELAPAYVRSLWEQDHHEAVAYRTASLPRFKLLPVGSYELSNWRWQHQDASVVDFLSLLPGDCVYRRSPYCTTVTDRFTIYYEAEVHQSHIYQATMLNDFWKRLRGPQTQAETTSELNTSQPTHQQAQPPQFTGAMAAYASLDRRSPSPNNTDNVSPPLSPRRQEPNVHLRRFLIDSSFIGGTDDGPGFLPTLPDEWSYIGPPPGYISVKIGGIPREMTLAAVSNLVFNITGIRPVFMEVCGASLIKCDVPEHSVHDFVIKKLHKKIWVSPLGTPLYLVAEDKKGQDCLAHLISLANTFSAIRTPRHLLTCEFFRY